MNRRGSPRLYSILFGKIFADSVPHTHVCVDIYIYIKHTHTHTHTHRDSEGEGNQAREDIVVGAGNDALLTFIRNGDGTLGVPLAFTLKADGTLRVNPLRVYA